MTYAFKVFQEMITGLSDYMDEEGYSMIERIRNRQSFKSDWQIHPQHAQAEINQKLYNKLGLLR